MAGWLAVGLMLVAGCDSESSSLRTLPGGIDKWGNGPGLLGVDGQDHPVINVVLEFRILTWDGSAWGVRGTYPGGACPLRDSVAEGNVAFGQLGALWKWDGSEYQAASPDLPQGGCTGLTAIAGNGMALALVADPVTGESSLIRAADANSPWQPVVSEGLALGYPTTVHAGPDGEVWLLGRKGIARVSSDGQQITRIADCTSPYYRCADAGITFETANGHVDPHGDFVFVVGQRGGGLSSIPQFHTVRAGATAPEPLFTDPPSGRANMTSYGIGPDGRVWAIWSGNMYGTDRDVGLFYRKRGDASWTKAIALSNGHGWQVAVSRRGTVYVNEGGSLGSGVHVLE